MAACAGEENKSLVPNDHTTNNGSSSKQENPLSPGNLPPPGAESLENISSLTSNSSLFFQRKELWDSFSEELRNKVWENYSHSSQMTGAGPGGQGYYNTLFGRVSPVKSLSPTKSVSVHALVYKSKSGKKTTYYSIKMKSGNSCDAFLCVDSPQEGANTVVDSIQVSGAINMSEAGLFSPSDPVIMVSVFRETGDYVSNDVPIYGSDIQVTTVPGATPEDPSIEWGTFQKSVPLLGAGTYSLTVTALSNNGDSVNAVSIHRTVIRQDIPKVELINLTPSRGLGTTGNLNQNPNNRYAPVNNGDTVSMNYVDVNVRLLSQGTTNVGIKFENLDETGLVRYVSAGGEFRLSDQEPKLPLKTAILPLFQGYNKIRVSTYNSVMDYLNLSPSEASGFEVSLTNALPQVNIKMISPQDGSVVEASQAGESLSIQFCLTDLFSIPGNPNSKGPGECITNWQGEAPVVVFNNFEYKGAHKNFVTYNASSGIYTLSVKPSLGGNNIQVSISNTALIPNPLPRLEDPQDNSLAPVILGKTSASFVYGKVNKLFENGVLKESDNFLARGLSLEINKSLISSDVKKILTKYLNQDSFKQSLREIFAKKDSGSPVVCTETGALSISDGDTTIDFLPEGFEIGNIVVNQIEPKSDGRLHLDVSIQGFHGEANLRGFNAPVQVQIGGKDANFVPLSIWVKELRAKIALRLGKENALMKVMIERQSAGEKAVTLVGEGPMGNVAHVNSQRNPLAAGLESYDAQTGLLSKSFGESLESTILCGVEAGLNHKENGLPRWDADLLKLVSYNNLNPFRIPMEFEMLNKLLGIDLAYNILRGDIQLSARGITIRNVPMRASPSPRILNALPADIKNALVGSLSMPSQTPELAAPLPETDENKNLSLSLSEDIINQALFAATMAGMLDLDIDPNFYSNNQLSFFNKATPTVRDMFGQALDFNQNGINDDSDLPVLMKMRPKRLNPPTIHFLTAQEVVDLKTKMDSINSTGASEKNSDNTAKTLNLNGKYFRISLSNLDLAFYRVLPVGVENGGTKAFCFLKDPVYETEADYNQRPLLPDFQGSAENKRVCRQFITYDYEIALTDSCKEGFEKVIVPVKNGQIISAIPGSDEEVPMIRFKGDIILHGVIQGISRETLAKHKYVYNPDSSTEAEKLKLQENPQASNFVRIRFLSKEMGPAAPFANFALVEAHTTLTDITKDFSNQLTKTLVPFALGEDCQNLNELNISIPDKLPAEKSAQPVGLEKTLQDFGIDTLDLGLNTQHLPELKVGSDEIGGPYDSTNLYMNLKMNLGLCYLGESCQ